MNPDSLPSRQEEFSEWIHFPWVYYKRFDGRGFCIIQLVTVGDLLNCVD